MTQEQFLKMLAADGFPEPVLVDREADGFLESHTHPFEVKALVISGRIDLIIDGAELAYSAGDVFHLLANQEHAERYGEKGVQYLASRNQNS